MLLRKPLPLWISVSLFVTAVAMIPLIGQVRRRPVSLPSTLTELTVLLSHEVPSLYMVLVIEDHPENGFYICTQPQPREKLFRLQRGFEIACKRKWQGVVYCERTDHPCGIIEEHFVQGWGEYGMQIGSIQCFGAPALLRRIHEAIFDQKPTK